VSQVLYKLILGVLGAFIVLQTQVVHPLEESLYHQEDLESRQVESPLYKVSVVV